MSPINKKQILIGIITMVIGLLIYFIDRPPGDTYLVSKISNGVSLHNIIPNIFGPMGMILPAFIHVFAFSLITSGLLGCRKKGCLVVCVSWFTIDLAFELGQKYDAWALSLIPDFFSEIPFLEASGNYFKLGTFDYYDLAAILIGSTVAFLTVFKTIPGRENIEIQ